MGRHEDGRAVDETGSRAFPPALTGAGDSFVGALMVRLAEGSDLESAARFACAVGALVVQRVGASDGAAWAEAIRGSSAQGSLHPQTRRSP